MRSGRRWIESGNRAWPSPGSPSGPGCCRRQRRTTVTIHTSVESVRLLLKRAMDANPKVGGTRIGSVRILVGILDTDRGRVARALEGAGVDRASLRARAVEALAAGAR